MFASNDTDAVNSADMEQSSFCDNSRGTGCNGDDNHHQHLNAPHNRMDIGDPIASTKTDLSNLKVTVGIDEDLQMILEMDPSIVDLVRKIHAILVHCFPFLSFCSFLFIPSPQKTHSNQIFEYLSALI